jgi:TonB family protein
LAARARYRPALDAAGRPVPGTDEGRVVWQAPGTAGEPARILVPPPAPAPPPPPRIVPPQRARANLNSYFSTDDYPAAALRADHRGTVAFSLGIGVNGRVADCRITVSSGSEPLDAATCRILRSRARYIPARDAGGTPVEGRDSGRVTWALPDPPEDRAGIAMAYRPARPLEPEVGDPAAADIPPGVPGPPGEGVSWLRVAIGPDGQVIGCDIRVSSGSSALDAAACRLYAARARFEPARDMAGAAVCDVAWTGLDWRPAFAARPPARPGTRPASARPPRPLREQLGAGLCPDRPAAQAVAPAALQDDRPRLPSLFVPGDYPVAALRANQQGTVAFRLVVGPDGRVTDCVITASSGASALDQATCRIIRERAHYTPARDAAGRPVTGRDSGSITWRLPSG